MDLKTNIQQELWDSIEKNYDNESYSSAILDAIHLLTETIRNKTGLEGDGSSLVGQAFGSSSPMIQLNKGQTESEKNVQKGMVDLLRGVYTTIRNPRSHDKHSDSKSDADSIILFLDYILKLIDKSKIQFELTTFLNRVFDKHFVRSNEYSDLLTDEIPKRQRLDVAIEVILRRKSADAILNNLHFFMRALIEKMEEREIRQLYHVISDELKYTSEAGEISTILKVAPAKYWEFINKAVRMRIENMLFEDANSGYFNKNEQKCVRGALSTWIESEHLKRFENYIGWSHMLVRKLSSNEEYERAYIEKYFWDKLCFANKDQISYSLEKYFLKGFKEQDTLILERLKEQIQYFEDHPWWDVFEEELKGNPEIQYIDFPF
ncbi:TIGR02391 family protein [Paenibacillus sp. FSL H7-689]|uniref:TIGR02391 family protein n=1 Tax=Paenibacillus sp. FSL H7-689 TaxID=1227349 RepID=UPI0003E2BCC4|nr:TIGR02391 family protein [Paenibacillus sp. FSL H7-689]ETT44729.1 hypothetical protein C170_22545 [Paenibacillus sp. FSL H7-689]